MLVRVANTRYVVEWESSHDEGLRALERCGFDMVVLDQRLGSDSDAPTGLDFLREANRRSLRVPILFLTGTGSHAVDLQAMELGAVDHLSKQNLSPELIERSIRYGVENSQGLFEAAEQGTLFQDEIRERSSWTKSAMCP